MKRTLCVYVFLYFIATCANATTTYNLIRSGTCTSNGAEAVKTRSECQTAARALYSRTLYATTSSTSKTTTPAYCFVEFGRLKFDGNIPLNTGKCSATKICICKATKKEEEVCRSITKKKYWRYFR